MKIEYCPVCGWGPFVVPYESVEDLRSSFDICDCCGCEYGYDDNQAFYENWLSEGCTWFEPKAKPEGWLLDSQIKYQVRPWPPQSNET